MTNRNSSGIASDAHRWVLVATLEGEQRVVDGDTCVAAAEALVVIMALAIDPISPVNASALQDLEQANAGSAQPTRPPTAPMTLAAPMPPPASIAVEPNSSGEWRVSKALEQARTSAPPRHPQKSDRLGKSLLLLGERGSLPEAFAPDGSVRALRVALAINDRVVKCASLG